MSGANTAEKHSRDMRWLCIIALAARAATALPQSQPGYMDAAYYYDVAANLAHGLGFTENFAWNYLSHPVTLPQPSNAYWMPLTSMIVAPFLMLPFDGYRSAQIIMIVLSALLIPIPYAISIRWFARRDWAWASALLMLASAFYLPFWTAIDSFALYAAIGTAAFWLIASLDGKVSSSDGSRTRLAVTANPWVRSVLAGVLIALGHLTRADGFLLFVAFAAIRQERRRFLQLFLVALAAYAVVMTPWFLRNLSAFGTLLPGGGTVFMRSYDDLFAYDQPLTFDYWWTGGMPRILNNIARALILNITTLAGALQFVFFVFALGAMFRERARAMVRGAAIYLAALLFITTFVFSLSGPRGTFLHSLTAVLPLLYALAPPGLSSGIAWIAARRRSWNAPQAERVFGIAFLLTALSLSIYFYASNVFGETTELGWNNRFIVYRQVDAFLQGETKGIYGPILCINPPAYYYFNQQPAIALPSDDALALIHAAVQFGAKYFVLEPDHPEYLDGLYAFRTPDQRFQLRATFADAVGAQVQLYQIVPLH